MLAFHRLASCNFKLSQVTVDEDGVHEEFENLSIAKSGSFHWARIQTSKISKSSLSRTRPFISLFAA